MEKRKEGTSDARLHMWQGRGSEFAWLGEREEEKKIQYITCGVLETGISIVLSRNIVSFL